MNTPIDSLKPGDHITVVQAHDVPPDVHIEYNGKPFKVLCIQLPFIAVADGRRMFSLDARAVDVLRMDRKYVRAWKASPARRKAAKDPCRCARCGGQLAQQQDATTQQTRLVCPQCGWPEEAPCA